MKTLGAALSASNVISSIAAIALITPFLVPATVSAQAIIPVEDQFKKLSFLNDSDALISDPFTPFGNSLNVAKFGDDGSRVMVDLSGVLLWGNREGEYREVPDTQLAVPLYVSNNELIVWNNRFADFDNYEERPDLDLRIYRVNADGEITSSDINVRGKEVLETPEVTTTSGSLVITTSERVEGQRDNRTVDPLDDFYFDTLTTRVYRVTFTGEVQRIASFNDGEIPIDNIEFSKSQEGPGLEALGYGSDGSLFYKYLDFEDDFFFIGAPAEDRFLWVNSLGEQVEVELESGGPLTRVIAVSERRLVLEEGGEIRDYRRPNGKGSITPGPTVIPVNGELLDIGKLTTRGDARFFYTQDTGTNTIRTFELTDSGADEIGQVVVASGDAEVVKVNPTDGSAIIQGEAGSKLIWLFPDVTDPADTTLRFIEIDNSELASPLFVSNDECILWTNARDAIPAGNNGVPNPAVVEHLVRTPVTFPTSDQDQDSYDSAPATEGSFMGGDGAGATAYVDNEVITLSDGSRVTVDAVNVVNGDVEQFTVDSTTSSGTAAGTLLTQISTTGTGAGFTMTVQVDNLSSPVDRTIATPLIIDGIYVINTPRAVPVSSQWVFATAEKTNPDAALLRTYQLSVEGKLDSDNDGLTDEEEIVAGTDPFDPDSDDDGLSDGEEVNPFYLIAGSFTWEQARLDARLRGGQLATIKTNAALEQVKARFGNNLPGRYWIGLSDLATEGAHVWVDGDPLGAFNNWGPGQPDNQGDADAVEIKTDFTWNDTNGSELKGYVIELMATDPNDASSIDPSNRVKDGDLWVDFDNDGLLGVTEIDKGTDPRNADTDGDGISDGDEVNPYFIITENFTWSDAVDNAGFRGGILAVIDSEDELFRVKSKLGAFLPTKLWIGASDLDGPSGSPFRWLTGGLTNDQTEEDYDGFSGATPDPNEGFFVGGSNYVVLEVITLSDGSSVTVDAVNASGNVIEFTVDSTTSSGAVLAGSVLQQVATDSAGTNFSMTVRHGNIDSDVDVPPLGNWAAFQPDSFFGPVALEALTDYAWNDAIAFEEKGYILKLPETDPLVNETLDSDSDGLTDEEEINIHQTNPYDADSDNDGIDDGSEVANGTNPKDPNDPTGGSGDGAVLNEELQHKNIAFINDDEVVIADPFTPFANSLDIAKFGDDGSRVLLDLSGVLLWGNLAGEYRNVPGTELAVPLYVSNNELIVWNNRYADFDNYDERPELDVKLYRVDADGEITSTDLIIRGKEILETPYITTTSGSLVITTTERTEGARINDISGRPVAANDNLIARVYRVTFSGEVQRIEQFADDIIPVDNFEFEDSQQGPLLEALGYGSDGSTLFKYPDFVDDGNISYPPASTVDKYVWVNARGDSEEVTLASGGDLNRVLFVSTSRLVLVEENAGGKEIRDYRRPLGVGPVVASPTEIIVAGDPLQISNVTIQGNIPYFYTREGVSNLIRTYQLTDEGAEEKGASVVPGANSTTVVSHINPADGSAILQGEPGDKLAWIFATALQPSIPSNRAIEIEGSELAQPLFVSNAEVVLWTNANEAIPPGNLGLRNPAEVVHYVRLKDGQIEAEGVTELSASGTYVLNTPPVVPVFDLWRFTTAEKTAADTARLRTYRLYTGNFVDTDNDGLLDKDEILIGTDPADPDSDDDGLLDGQEVHPYYLIEGAFTWEEARLDALARVGHLAVVGSSADADAVKAAIGNVLARRYWIGGFQEADFPENSAAQYGDFNWVNDLINPKPEDPIVSTKVFGVSDLTVSNQDETFYDSNPTTQGSFMGGSNYEAGDEIILSDGSKVTVNAVGSGGEVTQFTVDSVSRGVWAINYSEGVVSAGAVLTQDSSAGSGTGFKLTVQADNLAFTNWAEFQPDNLGDADALELLPNHEWNDAPAGEQKGYVLQVQTTNPLEADSDNDGLNDGDELALGTDPRNDDSDDDGLKDGEEVNETNTNPLDDDSDDDGLVDGVETNTGTYNSPTDTGTNPNNPDTDGDGISDGVEVGNGSNPNDPNSPNSGGSGDANPDHYNAEFLSSQDVSIPNPFSPFGNSLGISKYGDDGSSATTDLSGVIIWADASGTFRRLPNTEQAVPLYVTNSEILVWQNRFADYDNYDERPTVEVLLYRLDGSGNPVATQLDIQGKEIVGTPIISTTTGSIVLATSEVVEGEEVVLTVTSGDPPVEEVVYRGYIDSLTIRNYRVTFSGAVQRIGEYVDDVERRPKSAEWANVQDASDLKALAFGSDGSSLLQYTASVNQPRRNQLKYLWVNSSGISQEVPVESLDSVVSVSNTRLVIQPTTEVGLPGLLQDFRRSNITDQLTEPFELNIEGSVMEFPNYTKTGDIKFFYTLENGDTVRTYRLGSGVPNLVRISPLRLPISDAAIVGPVNPRDGSAIIRDAGLGYLLWVHDEIEVGPDSSGYSTEIASSASGKPLFVTNNECVLWENAEVPIPEGGVPVAAVLVHHELKPDVASGTVRRPIAIIEGTYVIDAAPFTPGFAYWFINTAEKVAADTAKLRGYRLRSAALVDTDNDGLFDNDELTIHGTDPFDPDSDNDGLIDGLEVNPYYVTEGSFTWEQALVDAEDRSGQLAVINVSTKVDRVKAAIGTVLARRYWIGGNDLNDLDPFVNNEGAFRWIGEFPPPFLYANWADAQPDNLNDSDGIELLPNHQWNDAPVGEQKGYILERPVSDPLNPDSDGDGLNDGDEIANNTDPSVADTDNDGLTDNEEVNTYGTDPLVMDTDGDGLTDGEEVDYDTDPNNPDTDGDGINDGDEIANGTNPLNGDSDGDGLVDSVETNTGVFVDETNTGTDPGNPDTDGDGLSDGAELINNTDPFNSDSDNDGLTDGEEVNTYRSNPTLPDTDNDGLLDGEEVNPTNGATPATDPTKRDTDGDTYDDLYEIINGFDPTNPNDPDENNGPDDNTADHYNVEFVNEEDVSIPDPFTPFGNTLATSKYGDDGSSVIADLSGALIWSLPDGTFRTLPDVVLGSPLYVTRNEVVVWKNRFADFENYAGRPKVEVVIYRLDPVSGEPVATPLSTLQGKEVIDTAQLTTTTGSFIIATTERVRGARERDPDDNIIVDFYDDVTIRFYRVAFDGSAPFIARLRDKIPYETDEFNETQVGPDTQVLSYGSDGSMLLRYSSTDGKGVVIDDDGVFLGEPKIVQKYVWIDSLGSAQYLTLENLSRAVSVSNTRLVIEAIAGEGLLDYRRIGLGGLIAEPLPIAVDGAVLDFINLTRAGVPNYFYTVEGSVIRTYLLRDSAAEEVRVANFPQMLSSAAKAGAVNPVDGSAIIIDEDKNFLLWLHEGAGNPDANLTVITRSSYAVPLYVTSDECVLWENALAPLPGNGVPEEAILVHHERVEITPIKGTTIRREILAVDGSYIIDGPQFTPDFPYWYVNTAQKDNGNTVKLRRYLLRSLALLDSDQDGLLDAYEDLVGTDPNDPDSDDDGLMDGQEVNPYYRVDGSYSWNAAIADAVQRGGNAAVITSENELNRVMSAMGNFLPGRYWLGGNDIAQEGFYQWVTGETFFPFDPITNYKFFADGQPDNGQDSDAIEMLRDFKWNDARVDEEKGYILELQPTDPLNPDSDDDDLKDGDEVNTHGTNPQDEDTDGDGYEDGEEVAKGTNPLDFYDPSDTDADGDGLTDAEEIYECFTDRFNPDSDGDGLSDGDEKNIHDTNPLDPDTDDDGSSDGDEIENGTDPLVASFGGGGGVGVGVGFTFADSNVYGSYTGFVRDGDNNTLGIITMKVSKAGKFSGKLADYGSAQSGMKGSFDLLGNYSGQQYNADGLASNAQMNFKIGSEGDYRIGGILVSPDGREQYYNLTRIRYSKSSTTNLAGDYTFVSPSNSTNLNTVPAGDGIATGKVGYDGKTKIKGYSNSGTKYRYSGHILEGDTLALFVRTKNSEVIAGILKFSDLITSDISGSIRHSKRSGIAGAYSGGFDEMLNYRGSRYNNTGFVSFPVDGFVAQTSNSLGSFISGIYRGTTIDNHIFTWESRGSMSTPKLPTYSLKGKMKNKTGMFTDKFTYRDPSFGYVAVNTAIRGVVFQKQNEVRGQAITQNYSDRYVITPNLSGDVAPVTVIYPRRKILTALEQVYQVNITLPAGMPWQVVIPDDINWVTVDKAGGVGSDVVVVTVTKNDSGFLKREATIEIAGLTHKIEQDWREE